MKGSFRWPVRHALSAAFAVTTTACAALRGHPSLDATREHYNKCADEQAMVVHNNSRLPVHAYGYIAFRNHTGSISLAVIRASRTDTLMLVPQMTVDFVLDENPPGGGRAAYYELKRIALECI